MACIRSTRAGLAGLLFATTCGSALADAARHEEVLNRLAPHDRPAYVEKIIARQQAERSQSAAPDVTPPVLTMFNAATTLNVSKAAAPFRIAIKATDDLSGFSYVSANAIGPSGQTIFIELSAAYPATNFSGSGGFNPVSHLLEPGTWKFTHAYGYDAAGNFFSVNESGLAALGNTTFTVVNNSGYDLVKPLLTSGKILTPAVSLAAHATGTTNKEVYVGVKVSLTDAGNTAVAGVNWVSLTFCQPDTNTCIGLSGSLTATGLTAATLTAATQVSVDRGNVPGDYTLVQAVVFDHAGNHNELNSPQWGGTTDFSTMFPTTVIKLKP